MSYEQGGVKFSREAFVSAPDEVIVLRLQADRPGNISFDLSLDRPERFETVALDERTLQMTGQLNDGRDGGEIGLDDLAPASRVSRTRATNISMRPRCHASCVTSSAMRGAASALAGWAKFGALVIVPLWASYPRLELGRKRSLASATAKAAALFIASARTAPLPGGHRPEDEADHAQGEDGVRVLEGGTGQHVDST